MEDDVEFCLTDESLLVKIAKSPAITHLRATGTEPCKYFAEQTRTLYSTVADSVGLSFNLDYYDDSGKAELRFTKRKY